MSENARLLQKLTKPRIHFVRDFFNPAGQWRCASHAINRSGYGATPGEAYENWKDQPAYIRIGVSA